MGRFSVQLVTFGLAMIGLAMLSIRFRRNLWLAAPALLWLLHVAFYYLCVLFVFVPFAGFIGTRKYEH